MTTTAAKPWPTSVPLCGKTTTRHSYDARPKTVSCCLPIGHDGTHKTVLDDGSVYIYGPDHDHEGVAP